MITIKRFARILQQTMRNKYIIICLICMCSSCMKPEGKITDEQIEGIRDKFTKEEIIYFFETVFFHDPSARDFRPFVRDTEINKWRQDVAIKVFGNKSAKNMQSVYRTIDYLNSLNLPIRVYISTNRDYNLGLYFGNKSYIEQNTGIKIDRLHSSGGFGRYYLDSLGYITEAIVGIDNSIDTLYPYKNNRVLEELTQVLGIPGDSYSNINSVFYQSDKYLKYQEKLLEIDERILRLLYSDNISIGLSLDEFYDSFEDTLPDTEIKKQDYIDFEEFINNNRFSSKTIELFFSTAFASPNYIIDEPHIQKWNNDISFAYAGEIKRQDSLIINGCVKLLSEYINKPRILPRESEYKNANLLFEYHQDSVKFDRSAAIGMDMFNYQIYKGKISLTRSQNVPIILKKKVLIRFLLNILGLKNIDGPLKLEGSQILGGIDKSNMLLSEYDEELLKLFFSKTLKSGMKKSEIVKVLAKYYNIKE